MKAAKHRPERAAKPPEKLKAGRGRAQGGKSTNTTKGQCSKPAGQTEDLLVKKDGHLLDEGKCDSSGNPACVNVNLPKIKLQLFPIDEGTRMRLEKDGYHPYLELTLSNRKRISSVLKHINSKWSRSSVVLGEPVLLPFHASGDLVNHNWTLKDAHITARDVYEATGSPSVFRLRYGWIPKSESKSFQVPPTGPPVAFVQPGIIPGITAKENITDEGKQMEAASVHVVVTGASDTVLHDKLSPILGQPQDNKMSTDVAHGQSPNLWDDNLTNISIGGLLSEVSLQGRFANCDPKSNGSKTDLQPSQLVSDSFDAFIAAQVNCSQGPRPTPHSSSSSILDAEDTCHAFSFQKSSSFGKVSQAFGADIQCGQLQEKSCNEAQIDLSLCSRVYNDESSLGLSGIKWNDSLGPFDFGLSSSRKITCSDSLNLSKIISQQSN